MADNNGQNQSWWSTVPGIFTSTAALITAVGGLIVILNSNGCFKNNTKIINVDTIPITKKDTLKVPPESSYGPPAKQNNPNINDTPEQNVNKFKIVSISPSIGTVLSSSSPFQINMQIHYRLVTADSALFVAYLEHFSNVDECASGRHETIAGATPNQISIKRGEGDLSIKIIYNGNVSSKMGLGNSGHVAPNASLWAGFDNQNRVIVMQEGLWSYSDYCYQFNP
jgi:hypothetical protein